MDEQSSSTTVSVKNADEALSALEHFRRLERLERGIPGEIARVTLKSHTLVAVYIIDSYGVGVRFHLYDHRDGYGPEIPAEKAHALAAIAHAGFVK